MVHIVTKSEINRLGERLRGGQLTAEDIKLLDLFRRGFRTDYETLIHILREEFGLVATGRPAKSTNSIIEKLQREKSRLVTIQDIAGCRVIVPDCKEQNRVVGQLIIRFPDARIIDRRDKPSSGYRAVHFVPTINDKPIEVQIRTLLQHKWAEVSERLADIDRAIKYGQGPETVRKVLDNLSKRIERYEKLELLDPPPFKAGDDQAAWEQLEKSKQQLKELVEEFIREIYKILDEELDQDEGE